MCRTAGRELNSKTRAWLLEYILWSKEDLNWHQLLFSLALLSVYNAIATCLPVLRQNNEFRAPGDAPMQENLCADIRKISRFRKSSYLKIACLSFFLVGENES